jgi:ribonuclease HII
MRRAFAGLAERPDYALTDGFKVDGLGTPGLAVWKGDQVAACVAAASVVAKVTRDRIMQGLHGTHPEYGFDEHKGYSTPVHQAALAAHGPCPEHRFSYANVAAVGQARRRRGNVGVALGQAARVPAQVGDTVAMEGGPR